MQRLPFQLAHEGMLQFLYSSMFIICKASVLAHTYINLLLFYHYYRIRHFHPISRTYQSEWRMLEQWPQNLVCLSLLQTSKQNIELQNNPKISYKTHFQNIRIFMQHTFAKTYNWHIKALVSSTTIQAFNFSFSSANCINDFYSYPSPFK